MSLYKHHVPIVAYGMGQGSAASAQCTSLCIGHKPDLLRPDLLDLMLMAANHFPPSSFEQQILVQFMAANGLSGAEEPQEGQLPGTWEWALDAGGKPLKAPRPAARKRQHGTIQPSAAKMVSAVQDAVPGTPMPQLLSPEIFTGKLCLQADARH